MGPCQSCKQKEKNSEIIIPDDISTIRKSGKDTQSKTSKQQNGSFIQNWSDLQIESQEQKKREQQGNEKNTAQGNQNDENIRRGTNTYFCSIENDVESNKNKIFNNAIIDINENKSDIEILLELEKMNSNLNLNAKDEVEENQKKPNQQFLDQLTQSNKSQTSKTQTNNNQTYTNKTKDKDQQSERLSMNNILKDLDD
ncbi:hypothetical protein TTHERM_00013430 (macronuclear) [Tetrahymena thermophila SB210]|uniref:Uncharacterized protein n=1 Tax=Tetrahymena thermophila (strain SB210) TaxID=312017 RepID=Q22RP5_TETTS|nr:hypothetical protein TTHERM_00013430 [Tetrahymena thermophila SB210]EAR88077.1 hypothetical protein TTHERM_00013430 [Tetrahymena thermophila SB210]|eukprot:XP_001008322.1 hypothetical protein TTHERM_00013430 [Tetrahymena thermophila SB210]